MRPSTPGSISTKAPKSARRVTVPVMRWPVTATADGLPGLGLKLLEAEGDFLGFRVDFEDFELEFLADGEHVFGLGDAGVGDVGDVEQAVDAAEVDECAVGHEGADGAGDDVAFLHGFAAGLGEAAGLLFEDDAAIDDDVFVGDVELGDAAGDLGADQLFELGGVFGSAAAGGHEGADADIDAEAALDDFGDGADDGELLGKGGFEGRPVAGLRHFEARELVVVLFVAAGDGDGEGVAGLDGFGVVLEGRAGQNAFGLVADVEEDLVGGEGDDGALQLPWPGSPLCEWLRSKAESRSAKDSVGSSATGSGTGAGSGSAKGSGAASTMGSAMSSGVTSGVGWVSETLSLVMMCIYSILP